MEWDDQWGVLIMMPLDVLPHEKISVIMPVCNAEELLREAIESILRQSCPDWSLLLVDDGSTDQSPEICDEYARRDPRIQVIHTGHAGVSHARNTGLDRANGEWVCFVDSDDWLEPDAFETLLRHADGADVVMGRYYHAAHAVGPQPVVMDRETEWTAEEKLALDDYGFYHTVWDKLYRRACIRGRFDETLMKWEDSCFNVAQVDSWDRIVLLPVTLYHYRTDDRRATLSKRINPMHIAQARTKYELFERVFAASGKLRSRNAVWYVREIRRFFLVVVHSAKERGMQLLLIRMWLEDEQLLRELKLNESVDEGMRRFWDCVQRNDGEGVCACCLEVLEG